MRICLEMCRVSIYNCQDQTQDSERQSWTHDGGRSFYRMPCIKDAIPLRWQWANNAVVPCTGDTISRVGDEWSIAADSGRPGNTHHRGSIAPRAVFMTISSW